MSKQRMVVVGAILVMLSLGYGLGRMRPMPSSLTSTLNPSAAPGATSSYTLMDIYNRLNAGTAGTQSTFTEPSAGPGTGTMATLNEIMGKAPALDGTNGAVETQVRKGKTYWGLTSGGWGTKTGSLYGGCTCTGTLDGTRWCDNGNGTVTDLTTCQVWMKNANCGATLGGVAKTGTGLATDRLGWSNATTWASDVVSGVCGLTDGSVEGDWRLPTLSEVKVLTSGTEAVSSGSPRAFTSVQSGNYWSSTIYAADPRFIWFVNLSNADVLHNDIYGQWSFYVWPVRGGHYGRYKVSWTLVPQGGGSSLTCAQVAGLLGVSVTATDGGGTSFVQERACEEGLHPNYTFSAWLPLRGSYTVSVEALNTAGQSIGTAPTISPSMAGPLDYGSGDLGTVVITLR